MKAKSNGKGGAPAKWSTAELEEAIRIYPELKSWPLVARRLRLPEYQKDPKGAGDRLRLAVNYYRHNRRAREN